MPAKRFRPQRPPRVAKSDPRAGGVPLLRRAVPQPDTSTSLRALPTGPEGGMERWELICRDGWDWQKAPTPPGGGSGPPMVWVRAAILNPDQAQVVGHWLSRIRDSAVWWEVSRAMQTPESAPTVAQAMQTHPWLRDILAVMLEASTEGAPPPPPRMASASSSAS